MLLLLLLLLLLTRGLEGVIQVPDASAVRGCSMVKRTWPVAILLLLLLLLRTVSTAVAYRAGGTDHKQKGGRDGRREGRKEGGREGGRDGRREGGTEGVNSRAETNAPIFRARPSRHGEGKG